MKRILSVVGIAIILAVTVHEAHALKRPTPPNCILCPLCCK